MKDIDKIKVVFITVFTAIHGALGTLAIPFYILVGVNIIDYFTGIYAAKCRGEKVSSNVGFHGIAKKVCMWLLVLVGVLSSANALLMIATILSIMVGTNVYLAVFNLLPVPPLDGSRILFYFLPTKYYFAIMRYERYIYLALFALLYIGLLDRPLAILSNAIVNLLNIMTFFLGRF